MKNSLFVLLLVFPLVLSGQELPSNFQYQRETGQKSGVPIFHVSPSAESIAYDAERGNTFEAVGALVQPELDKYGIFFMNAKRTFQFSTNRDKSCTLTLDGESFRYPKFTQGTKDVLGRLRIETVVIKINQTVFDKLIDASNVIIRCGVVHYNLDEDNMDALRYLASEMDKDLERRGITIPN